MVNINEPIYVRVQRELMQMLNEGSYTSGSKIPSERELSIHFGASRMTLRKAVDQLVHKGHLERRGTSGTYMPERLFTRTLSHEAAFSVSEAAYGLGRVAGSKLLFFEKQLADEGTASKLHLDIGEPVICISRLRTIDGVPVCLEVIQIPAAYLPGFSASDVIENASLYKFFEEKYSLELKTGETVIGIGWLSEAEAEPLGLTPESGILEFQCVTLLEDDKPFEYLRSINHPEYVNFRVSGNHSCHGPESIELSFAHID